MLKFEMSGQRFELDTDPAKLTADELFAVEENCGQTFDAILDLIAEAMTDTERTSSRVLRALVAVAWLAHRRSGGRLDWVPFTRTVHPATIRVLGDEAPPPAAPKAGKRIAAARAAKAAEAPAVDAEPPAAAG